MIEDHKKSDARQKRESGTNDDFDERHQLLEDLTSRIRDHEDEKVNAKEGKSRKEDSLRADGLMIREKAMSQLSNPLPKRKRGDDGM